MNWFGENGIKNSVSLRGGQRWEEHSFVNWFIGHTKWVKIEKEMSSISVVDIDT